MNKLNILYEDNHIIVVVKPINILSQGDITQDDDMVSMIKNYIKEKYQKPGNVFVGLVHRLDRVVGGVMVFAKTSKAANRLFLSMQKGDFHKEYLAICHGKLKKEDTFIDYLLKTDNYNTVISNQKDGKLAILSYELIHYDQEKDLSLVKVLLKTGRHHQIRVQFQSRGYPLLGDNRYGHDNNDKIGLFAYKLCFPHPTKHDILSFCYIPHDKPFSIFTNSLNKIL